MFNWLFRRNLFDVVGKTRRVKVCGIFFRIKKLDAFDFASGSNAMLSLYQTYEDAKGNKVQNLDSELKKIKDHYRDVFMASVVEPKLVRKPEEQGLWVDNLFTEQQLVEDLYSAITLYTYGKKKLKL